VIRTRLSCASRRPGADGTDSFLLENLQERVCGGRNDAVAEGENWTTHRAAPNVRTAKLEARREPALHDHRTKRTGRVRSSTAATNPLTFERLFAAPHA
jgi:hypothetical protein